MKMALAASRSLLWLAVLYNSIFILVAQYVRTKGSLACLDYSGKGYAYLGCPAQWEIVILRVELGFKSTFLGKCSTDGNCCIKSPNDCLVPIVSKEAEIQSLCKDKSDCYLSASRNDFQFTSTCSSEMYHPSSSYLLISYTCIPPGSLRIQQSSACFGSNLEAFHPIACDVGNSVAILSIDYGAKANVTCPLESWHETSPGCCEAEDGDCLIEGDKSQTDIYSNCHGTQGCIFHAQRIAIATFCPIDVPHGWSTFQLVHFVCVPDQLKDTPGWSDIFPTRQTTERVFSSDMSYTPHSTLDMFSNHTQPNSLGIAHHEREATHMTLPDDHRAYSDDSYHSPERTTKMRVPDDYRTYADDLSYFTGQTKQILNPDDPGSHTDDLNTSLNQTTKVTIPDDPHSYADDFQYPPSELTYQATESDLNQNSFTSALSSEELPTSNSDEMSTQGPSSQNYVNLSESSNLFHVLQSTTKSTVSESPTMAAITNRATYTFREASSIVKPITSDFTLVTGTPVKPDPHGFLPVSTMTNYKESTSEFYTTAPWVSNTQANLHTQQYLSDIKLSTLVSVDSLSTSKAPLENKVSPTKTFTLVAFDSQTVFDSLPAYQTNGVIDSDLTPLWDSQYVGSTKMIQGNMESLSGYTEYPFIDEPSDAFLYEKPLESSVYFVKLPRDSYASLPSSALLEGTVSSKSIDINPTPTIEFQNAIPSTSENTLDLISYSSFATPFIDASFGHYSPSLEAISSVLHSFENTVQTDKSVGVSSFTEENLKTSPTDVLYKTSAPNSTDHSTIMSSENEFIDLNFSQTQLYPHPTPQLISDSYKISSTHQYGQNLKSLSSITGANQVSSSSITLPHTVPTSFLVTSSLQYYTLPSTASILPTDGAGIGFNENWPTLEASPTDSHFIYNGTSNIPGDMFMNTENFTENLLVTEMLNQTSPSSVSNNNINATVYQNEGNIQNDSIGTFPTKTGAIYLETRLTTQSNQTLSIEDIHGSQQPFVETFKSDLPSTLSTVIYPSGTSIPSSRVDLPSFSLGSGFLQDGVFQSLDFPRFDNVISQTTVREWQLFSTLSIPSSRNDLSLQPISSTVPLDASSLISPSFLLPVSSSIGYPDETMVPSTQQVSLTALSFKPSVSQSLSVSQIPTSASSIAALSSFVISSSPQQSVVIEPTSSLQFSSSTSELLSEIQTSEPLSEIQTSEIPIASIPVSPQGDFAPSRTTEVPLATSAIPTQSLGMPVTESSFSQTTIKTIFAEPQTPSGVVEEETTIIPEVELGVGTKVGMGIGITLAIILFFVLLFIAAVIFYNHCYPCADLTNPPARPYMTLVK